MIRTYQPTSGSAISTPSRVEKSHVIRKVMMKITFGSSSEEVHTLAQMGFTNPALIAWELTPWSFVIDWFLPVGNFISSLDATLGLVFVDGYKSTRVTKNSHSHAWWDPGIKNVSYHWEGSVIGSNSEETFLRSTLTSFPSPRLPSFKNPFSSQHLLNAVALLAQFKSRNNF